MHGRRFRIRIADMLLFVVVAALGAMLAREPSPYLRADPTYILAPVFISLTLACLVMAAIAAHAGREDRRASRWGFVLGCGAYLVMSQNLGFDYAWRPVASSLVSDALGATGMRVGSAGWTPAADLVQFLGFVRPPMRYG